MKYPVCFLFLFFAMTAHCLDRIAEVLAVDGVLKALGIDRVERVLEPHSDVFLGDILITEKISRGQIQFTDGTLVLLIPGSRYGVDAYSSEQNQYMSKLYQGGIRVSTGLIAKKSPENFQVGTPNATIGVRGTVFEARMLGGNLYVGSSWGGLSVKNSGGSLNIGADAPDDFAEVSSKRATPKGLEERPLALDLSHFDVPQEGVAFESVSQTIGMGAVEGFSSSFAWGPAVGIVSVFGVVVGVVASAAAQTPATFSHSH
jgi:hypothetical protein